MAKHWAFTLNNYSEEDEDKLLSSTNSAGVGYIVFGKEVGSSGTPHLQGHVYFSQKKRLSQILKLLPQAHYSVARNVSKSIEYAKKEGSYRESGTPPDVLSQSGKRTDLDEFKAAVKGGMVDSKELRETYSEIVAKYPRFALLYIRDHRPLPVIPEFPLRDWQSRLLEDLAGEPDSRSIKFVIDETGNTGKSYFAAYLEHHRDHVQVMKCGKRDDMAFELDETVKILLIDVSRSSSKFLNYQFLEDVKDGRVFSPKYESHTKRFNSPHLVVMMNEYPDMTALSSDRYQLTVL